MLVPNLFFYSSAFGTFLTNNYSYVLEFRKPGQEASTTFVFKETEIQNYFKGHPEQLPKDVPLYDYVTDKPKR
jgi:hypothetical protein